MILDEIAQATRQRVERAKEKQPLEAVRQAAKSMEKGDFLFSQAVKKPGMSFLCEIKKASPSKGIIAAEFPYLEIAREYKMAGADAVSILTEPDFFKGSNTILSEVSNTISLPLLRKDFIIDEYQIYEAKVIGASAILLICALLDKDTLCHYFTIAKELGLSALVEAHDEKEIGQALASGADIIGVNNRNLKTFEVDIKNGIRLRELVPPSITFVAESGITCRANVAELEQAGVDAVLIGETLMRSNDKKKTLMELRGMQDG